MESLETELDRARELDVGAIADAIESIGFECTRCGGCCKGETDDPHTATVFPEEVRALQDAASSGSDGPGHESDDHESGAAEYDWRDVARPMPFGLTEGEEGFEGETFEWALQTDACGDCRFYEERSDDGHADATADGSDDGKRASDGGEGASDQQANGPASDQPGDGYCTVHEDRPLICRTYPFSLALAGTSQPMGEAVDEAGRVRAHECEGLGREICRDDARELAATLRERAIRELEEAIAVRDAYEPTRAAEGEVVVHDSEGVKDRNGRPRE